MLRANDRSQTTIKRLPMNSVDEVASVGAAKRMCGSESSSSMRKRLESVARDRQMEASSHSFSSQD